MQLRSLLQKLCRSQFALDLRSLACLRIGLGTLILLDVVLRLRDVTAFYTDDGIVPRSLVSIGLAYPSQWSFHFMNGTATFQWLLLLITAGAATMLACGYRTKLATVICWLMLVSLHTRNPIILNAGDKYLEVLTFWGIFLPLGAYWSFDSRSAGPIRGTYSCSLATLALLLQILLVYLCAGLMKQQVESWQTGDAIHLALSTSYVVTAFGQQLLNYPELLQWLTHTTVYLEIIGPVALVASRGWVRLFVVLTFALFHVALALCFSIGLFPWVCIVALSALLPAQFWTMVQRKPLPAVAHIPATKPVLHALANGIVTATLLVAIWSNWEDLGHVRQMPAPLQSAARAFRLPQGWRLFVDLEEVDDGWFVFHAQYADGRSKDWLTGNSPVSYDPPRLASATFPNFRWRKLCTNIRLEKFKPVAAYLGEYLLVERDRVHHDIHELVGLQISYVKPRRDAESVQNSKLQVFGTSFSTPQPLHQEVLYQWRNDALKYRSIFLTE